VLTEELPLRAFVETGTYRGESVRAVLPYFERIETIELSDELHAEAAAQFADEPKVEVRLGRSQDVLAELVPALSDTPTLFWLDAHWSDEPGSAGEGEPCPLIDELAAIGTLSPESVVMIDDARLFLSPPPAPMDLESWPTMQELLAALGALSDEHEPQVVDDVIVFFPSSVRDAVRNYAREHGTDPLADAARAREAAQQVAGLRAEMESAVAEASGRLDAIEGVIGALSEGSMAMQEALSQLRVVEAKQEIQSLERRLAELEPRFESLQAAIGKLVESTARGHELIAELSQRTSSEIETARAEIETARTKLERDLERRITELADRLESRLDQVDARIAQRFDQLDARLAEVHGQRSHIEETQRLVTLLVEADERREARRHARRRAWLIPLKAIAAPFVLLARPLRRPWARLKWSANASREHWRVRFSRLGREPKLGRLQHHDPIPLEIPPRYLNSAPPEDPPTISIVTPSYNQGAFIERTIRSVIDQQYPKLEYIVQDGGSTDDTREVLERYDSELTRWEMSPDAGQAQAINRGFTRASGDVMAYLNSDDLLLPGSLRYVARFFEAHPEIDVVYGHRVLVDENDMEIGRWVLPRHRDSVLSWADFIPQETLFWRRRAWESVGGSVDESFRFAIDWDLLVRMRDAGARIFRVPRFLGAFRVHTAQKTSAELGDAGADEMAIIRTRIHEREVSPEEIDRQLRGYLRRHVNLHKLYRAGLIRY
jgi:glycosyltransferase involved in cell wall biosynthesis